MECSYGVKDGECGHYKCEWCNECSEGSQIHRHCLPEFLRDQYGEMDADTEDTESVSLLADITECLPTEDEEAEIDAIRGNTPLSFGTEADEETLDFEENSLYYQIYRFETTSFRDFPKFQEFSSISDIHKYLTSEVSKDEFMKMKRDMCCEMIFYPDDLPIKMRIPVKVLSKGVVKHAECFDATERTMWSLGICRGIMTLNVRDKHVLMDMISKHSQYFFCDVCERFIFHEIIDYTEKMLEIPYKDEHDKVIYPKCENKIISIADKKGNSMVVLGEKLIAVVFPEKKETKPNRKRPYFWSDSDTD